jgi:hypothetical protein
MTSARTSASAAHAAAAAISSSIMRNPMAFRRSGRSSVAMSAASARLTTSVSYVIFTSPRRFLC